MFVGREHELQTLNRLYEQNRFHMVVVYGRRRVGKTALLMQFTRDKQAIIFTAQAASPHENLVNFSNAIYQAFGMSVNPGAFTSWADAFSFIGQQAQLTQNPLVLVFDEFPYAAEREASLPSVLQRVIDHQFSATNLFVILCGSNEGFMESEVLGAKSPLYGRRTAQLHLQPFDYYDAAKMLPGLSVFDLIQAYATFGGTPYYLAQYDTSASYKDNVIELLFDMAGVLFEEPMMLLRQELREPAVYNSVLGAIAQGATKQKAIADAVGISQNAVGAYLKTLESLGLIRRNVPFGDNPSNSRKGQWKLADPFFAYWYRFVKPSLSAIEQGSGKIAAQELAFGDALSTYIGMQFEQVCLQWLVRKNNAEQLPFAATEFGRWWGTDPRIREEVDVDVLAANRNNHALMCVECKWRNSFNETEAIATFERRATLIPGTWKHTYLMLCSKNPLQKSTQAKANAREGLLSVSAEDLFNI